MSVKERGVEKGRDEKGIELDRERGCGGRNRRWKKGEGERRGREGREEGRKGEKKGEKGRGGGRRKGERLLS